MCWNKKSQTSILQQPCQLSIWLQEVLVIYQTTQTSHHPSSSSLSHRSTVAHTDPDKAELLNSYFASCFNTVNVLTTHSPSPQHNLSIESLDLSHQEVQNLHLRTKPHSASGPDGISAWMLKAFVVEIAPSLASLEQANSLLNGSPPILCQFLRTPLYKMYSPFVPYPSSRLLVRFSRNIYTSSCLTIL